MANKENIAIIGTALKWRGVYDNNKNYYQENIVTLYGSVFRCRILKANGLPPVKLDEETNHLQFINQEIWDVIVDMSYYFNYVVDQENFNKRIDEFTKELESQIQDLQVDNLHQWEEIDCIKRILKKHHHKLKKLRNVDKNLQNQIDQLREDNERQQKEIDEIKSHSGYYKGTSVVNNGIWDNSMIWGNGDFWNNYRPSNENSCKCDPDKITELEETIKSLQEQLKEQKELIEQLLSAQKRGVVVLNYDEDNNSVELGGDIYVTDYNEPNQQLSVSTPKNEIKYDEEEQSVELD